MSCLLAYKKKCKNFKWPLLQVQVCVLPKQEHSFCTSVSLWLFPCLFGLFFFHKSVISRFASASGMWRLWGWLHLLLLRASVLGGHSERVQP